MGELIYLAERRAAVVRATHDQRPVFYFDLGCPFSYLAAERIERRLGDLEWVPASGAALTGRKPTAGSWSEAAERRAHALRLPLSWPEQLPVDTIAAHRVAALAAELGVGARFAIAASRLAFCGGFDLADPETIAEAAAAAGIMPKRSMAAALDPRWDDRIEATAYELASFGVHQLPAIGLQRRWFSGERAVFEGCALLRAGGAIDRPLAPAG